MKIREVLQLLEETTDVLNLSYFFAFQCKEKDQDVRGPGTELARIKLVDSIIIIFCHPVSNTLRLNFATRNITIDPLYI